MSISTRNHDLPFPWRFSHLLFFFYWSLWEPTVFWHFWKCWQVKFNQNHVSYFTGRAGVSPESLIIRNRSAGCLVFFHYCLSLLEFFLWQFFNFNFQESSFLLSLILFWFYGCNILSLPPVSCIGVSFKCLLVVTILVGYIPFFNFGGFAQVYGASGRDIHLECNLIGSSLHAEKIHSRSEIAGKGYGHLYFSGCYSPWPSRQL